MLQKKPKSGYKLTRSLYGKYDEIPKEWELISLSKITSAPISYGVLVPDSDPTGVPMLRSGALDTKGGIEKNIIRISKKLEEKYKKTRLNGGELLISLVGYTGQVTIVPDFCKGYNVSRALGVIRLKKEFDSKFFYYALKSQNVQKKIFSQSFGSAQPVINLEKLRSIEIISPPLKEQMRISQILSNLEGLIASKDELIETTQNLKTGLMQKLFSQGLHHNKFKKTKLGTIPNSWKLSKIGEFCKVKSGGTPNRKRSEYYDGSIPWVKTTEVNYNIITQTEETISEQGLQESAAKIFPKNILLFAMYGQGITRAKCAILGIDAATNQACAAIIPDEFMDVWFLYYWIQFRYERLRTLSSGTNQSNFNLDKVREILVPVPDKAEQEKIISIFSNMDNRIRALKSRRNALHTLKEGLMQKLLTGEIRVKE